jgi:hypothetical protein
MQNKYKLGWTIRVKITYLKKKKVILDSENEDSLVSCHLLAS